MTRVLHAEDDPNVASIVRLYLAHHEPSWELETVENGQLCLDRMAQGGIDLLLLDLVLPDTDGLKILGELARRRDATPVIMVSGHGQTELAVRALRAGAVDCIDKTSPQFLEIADVVKRVLSRPQEPSHPAPTSIAYRVLFVDVSSTTQHTIIEFFHTNAPHLDLAIAGSARDLAQFLAHGLPADAVVIGPTPDGASGLDVLRQIRSHDADLPVVLLTSRNDSETAIAAFKLGANDILLQKPGYLTDTVFSLNNLLHRAETEQRNAQLTQELESMNRSLESQVHTRTKELHSLSSRLLRIQEDERRSIARELHDELGQQLTGLRFQLESIHQQSPAALQPAVAEALATSDAMLRYLRELTQQLRPRVLDDLGLAPAIEWHANLHQRQTNIAVTLDISLPPTRLPGELETAAFRLVQEALTNIARHSGADSASVTLTTTSDGRLIVEISDRGRGFDVPAKLASHDSIGLSSLRERVNLAGGTLDIFSRVGQGTRLHAEFPLPA